MPSANSIVGLLEQLESRDIAVHQQRCVRVRNRNAGCMRCAEACTSGCISYQDNELAIDVSKCIGCGTCATVCPTCAIEARHPTDSELLQACRAAADAAEGVVVVACEQIVAAASGLFDAAKVVPVACLGRVDESLVAQLAGSGVAQVVCVQGKCDACEQKTGLQTALAVRDTANTLLETWGSPCRVKVSERFPAAVRKGSEAAFDEGRRAFFSQMGAEVADVARETADYAARDALDAHPVPQPKYLKVGPDGTLPHFVPDRRERLLDALASMGEPADELIETRLWGNVEIDVDACQSCRMCATFCPTGALVRFDDAGGAFGVEHFPGDCVKCRCCEDVCPCDALTLHEQVFARDLLSGEVQRFEMRPVENPRSGPSSIVNALRGMMKTEQIYER